MNRASMRQALAMAIFFVLALASCGGKDNGFDDSGRYYNKKYGFSFIPPKGWTFGEGATGECDFAAVAGQGELSVFVCVAKAAPEALFGSDDEQNCARLAQYIQSAMNGRRVECRPSNIQRVKAYSAMFLRQDAGLVSIVNLTAVRHQGRLLTMQTLAGGPTLDAARNLLGRNMQELTTASGSFWLN